MNVVHIGHAHIIPHSPYFTRLSTCVLQANNTIHTFSLLRDLIFPMKLKLGFLNYLIIVSASFI